MSGKNINFDNKKINNSNFYRNKKLFTIDNIDANKILVSKDPYGKKNSFKCFIGYNDCDDIRPLCIKLLQMTGYAKCFDRNEKYSKIWERVSNLMNIEFCSELIYGDNDKYIKTKIKSYEDKVNPNFQNNKIPKENASYRCLSFIMQDSVIRVNKKYYSEALLEECKYKRKGIKWRIL